MSTVRDLIKGSLRLIGAIAVGETPSAEEQTDALSVLNDMIDSWGLENLLIFSKVKESFSLSGSTQDYTMGSGGTFNTARPNRIEAANILDGTAEIPMAILTFEQWSQVSPKTLQSALPSHIYPDYTNPLVTISVWPIPDSAKPLVLYSWKPLSQFASADDVLSLPPGYAKALRYNLAIELGPEYGKPLNDVVVQIAADAKENIKRMNVRPYYLQADPGVMRGKPFNFLKGD